MVENTHINIEQACGDYRNWKYMAFCQTGVNKYYDIDIKSLCQCHNILELLTDGAWGKIHWMSI